MITNINTSTKGGINITTLFTRNSTLFTCWPVFCLEVRTTHIIEMLQMHKIINTVETSIAFMCEPLNRLLKVDTLEVFRVLTTLSHDQDKYILPKPEHLQIKLV